VARLASTRIRFLTEGAVSGAFTTELDPVADADDIRTWALQIADAPKRALPEIEARLRADPGDPDAAAAVRNLLDKVQVGVHELFQAHRDASAARLATEVLGRELHPWLVRSSLAERCIRRATGAAGTPEILAHVLVDTAGGDGRLGELLDRWLLDRPTFQALRAFRAPMVEQVRRLLPDHRNRHVLIINAGTGSLVARLVDALGQPPTVLTVVDQSRDALAFLDAGVVARPKDIELRTVQENLARFAIGRRRHELPPQDAVVIHGLLEYLPERLAVSLLETCRDLLTPEGHVVVCALGPTPDQALLDRLLDWPTIRRTRDSFLGLLRSSHLDVLDAPELTPDAALLASAVVDERTLIRPSPLVTTSTGTP
jgi:SAM-dependent methyltransferase